MRKHVVVVRPRLGTFGYEDMARDLVARLEELGYEAYYRTRDQKDVPPGTGAIIFYSDDTWEFTRRKGFRVLHRYGVDTVEVEELEFFLALLLPIN